MSKTLTLEQIYDAFGRARVSMPETLYECEHTGSLSLDINVSGDYTYDYSGSLINLSSSNGVTSVIQSRLLNPYQPGKSLLCFASFIMSTSTTSTERIGFFHEDHGIYFEKAAGTLSFNIRKDGSNNSVSQSNWNLRTLLYGDNILDTTKAQIFWCDLEWLGEGSVLCGFVLDRKLIPCHRFDHANVISSSYMRNAKLPFHAEITESTGTSTFKQVCAAALSEGGYQLHGDVHSVGTDGFTTVDSSLWMLGLRMNPDFVWDTVVLPTNMSCIVQSNQTVRGAKIELFKACTDTGSTWNDISYSKVQYTTSPVITPGDRVGVFYVESQDSINVGEGLDLRSQVGRDIAGTSDVFAVKVTTLSSAISTAVSLTWNEL